MQMIGTHQCAITSVCQRGDHQPGQIQHQPQFRFSCKHLVNLNEL
jgi:hypothetical protein